MRRAFTTRAVDNDGVRLASRDYGGGGPALLLMHGAGMEQSSLEPLTEKLRDAHRVITFDFRGHGASSTASTWTFASAVSDVRAVADAYGLVNPAVAGHSLGGMLAVRYGVHNPSCPGVVNIDGHGRGSVDQYLGYDENQVRAWWGQVDNRLDRLTGGPGAVALRALMLVLRTRATTTGRTLRAVTREVDALDLFASYRQLACPLLVFNATAPEARRAMRLWAGEGTAMVAAYRRGLSRDLAELAAQKDRLEVATIDSTHMLIRSHPAHVARRVTSFLDAARTQPAG